MDPDNDYHIRLINGFVTALVICFAVCSILFYVQPNHMDYSTHGIKLDISKPMVRSKSIRMQYQVRRKLLSTAEVDYNVRSMKRGFHTENTKKYMNDWDMFGPDDDNVYNNATVEFVLN